MRTFGKSSKLDNVLYDVRGPVVDEAARMEEDGMEILKLNIGNPYPFGFSAPQEVILDMLSNVRTSQGYSDSKGIFSARKAIMQYAQLRGIPGVTMSDIYTGNGVSELINLCMQALLDNGDEILIPAPDYPLWTATATLAGGKVVHYICDESSNWYPDIEDMRRKITPNTKAIVIINPNNPTGAMYPPEVLIIEGIHVFYDDRICDAMNLKLFIKVDSDICLLRRIARDMNERGRSLESISEQYKATVKPMREKYIDRYIDKADVVVMRGGMNEQALKTTISYIKSCVKEQRLAESEKNESDGNDSE